MKNIINPSMTTSLVVFGSLYAILFIIGNASGLILHNAFSQEITNDYTFENATHIQYDKTDDIHLKSSIEISMDLTKDLEGSTFSGEPYKILDNGLQVDINDKGKLKSYWYNLTNSGIHKVSISDTNVFLSFTFRMPIGPNSTVVSVEEISQLFRIDKIIPHPDGIGYLTRGYPISLNNTTYENSYLIVNQFDNETAQLGISSITPGRLSY